MDNNVLGIVALVISVVTAIIGAVNHTKIRSACCGRHLEASIDIDKTIQTPPQVESRAS